MPACGFEVAGSPVDAPSDLAPPDVPPDASRPMCVISIVAGGDHTCALKADGSVWCWGLAAYGQVGVEPLGTRCVAGTSTPYCFPSPQRVSVPAASALGLGGYHSCAVSSGGTYCWGLNRYGAFGDGTTANSKLPIAITPLAGATAFAAGMYHSCSRVGGDASCSGQNAAGEVGNNSLLVQTATTMVASDVAQLELGDYTTCAIDNQQRLLCWGRNTYRQIDSTQANKLVPTLVAGATNLVDIAVGRHHICAVRADNQAQCWGNNGFGQLGNGQIASLSPPVDVNVANVVEIAAERNVTCALTTAGDVYCFGEGYGAPTQIALPRAALHVTVGNVHACAITDDNEAWCWGRNSYGQLGNGQNLDGVVTTPQQVELCP